MKIVFTSWARACLHHRCLTFEHYCRDVCGLLDHWERALGTMRPLTPPSKPESEMVDSAVSRGHLNFYSLLQSVTSLSFSLLLARYFVMPLTPILWADEALCFDLSIHLCVHAYMRVNRRAVRGFLWLGFLSTFSWIVKLNSPTLNFSLISNCFLFFVGFCHFYSAMSLP